MTEALMRTNLYWVETGVGGRLATMARPRAGDWLEDELRGLKAVGIDVVVSLLTGSEVAELGLERERETCEAAGLRFFAFPIEDRQVPPNDTSTLELVRALHSELVGGRSVAIHCRMGIGRASLIAASVLRLLGVGGEEALRKISTARGLKVPDTDQQRQWILDLAP
jgi:protein-tyrosine phosphatase